MKSFKSYIAEESFSLDELDMDFLRRAEQITSFNLDASHFQTLKYKKEIQHLFVKHFFPGFNLDDTLNKVDKDEINKVVRQLKAIDKQSFFNIHRYNLKGVGPGEATMFFMIDGAVIGGGTSAGTDLFVDGELYEIKGAKYIQKDNIIHDFKLGGTVEIQDLMGRLLDLAQEMGITNSRKSIPKTEIQEMRQSGSEEFRRIEEEYVDRAFKYLSQNKLLIINNDDNGVNTGEVMIVGRIQKEDVGLERLTSNTLKPFIRMN